MAKPERMVRLLQGDVGSGKTLVAFLAMLTAVEAGAQAALMAPTELLARQHYATIAPLAEAAGVTLALLTGRDGQTQKKETLQGWPTARSSSWSARTRWCRRTSSSPISRWPWSTSSIASACTSAWRCRPRARRRSAGDDGHADPAHPDAGGLLATSTFPSSPRSRPAASRSTPAPFRSSASPRWPTPSGRRSHRRRGLLGVSADRGIGGVDLANAEERFVC
jgi:hypothetical protein